MLLFSKLVQQPNVFNLLFTLFHEFSKKQIAIIVWQQLEKVLRGCFHAGSARAVTRIFTTERENGFVL